MKTKPDILERRTAELRRVFLDSIIDEFGRIEGIPTPGMYESYLKKRIIPAYNRMGRDAGLLMRICRECCTEFQIRDARGSAAEFCTPQCSTRKRNRGRHKGLSAAERHAAKIEAKLSDHWASCSVCEKGRPCKDREALLLVDDALSRRDYGDFEAVETAQHQRATGMTRRRRPV